MRAGCGKDDLSIRSRHSTVGAPKGTKINLNGANWAIVVHFGLANAKSGSESGQMVQNGRLNHFGPFWSSTPSGSTVATP